MNFSDLPAPVFFVLVFVAVLVVAGVITWLVRRFSAERFGGTAARNRQPRLAIIDAASVDGRRRLVIIRRDNVEHLLMIGGPNDVVVETNIVRGNAAATAREAPPVRAAAVPLGEGGQWPLQPEPSPRPHRTPVVDDVGHWAPQPEPVRPPRVAAEDDWPLQPHAEPTLRMHREAGELPEEFTPAIARSTPETTRTPTPSVAPPAETAGNDHNLAEMANRLEAALRRPVTTGDTRPPAAPKPPAAVDASARIAPELRARKEPEAARAPMVELKAERPEPKVESTATPEAKPAADAQPARAEPKPGRVESKFGPPKPAQPKTLYDSLEQEMASLLGRPGGKT